MGKWVDRLGWIAGLSIFIMALLVGYEVVLRYIFHRAPMIADEFSAYLLILCVFFGLGYTLKRGGHIRADAVVKKLPPKMVIRLRLITLIIFLAYAVVFGIECFKLVLFSYNLHLRSESWLETPQYLVQIVMPIGLAGLVLALLFEIKQAVTSVRGSSPE